LAAAAAERAPLYSVIENFHQFSLNLINKSTFVCIKLCVLASSLLLLLPLLPPPPAHSDTDNYSLRISNADDDTV
jgi:hypothetical protein